MFPEAIQPYLDDMADVIDGLIFPTNNGYENAVQFDLANVRNKLKAYLMSDAFLDSVDLIKKEGFDVEVLDLPTDSTEKQPDTPDAFVVHSVKKPNVVFVISTPGYFGFANGDDSEGWTLFDIENQVNEVKQHLDAYKDLVENRKQIREELRDIQSFVLLSHKNPQDPYGLVQLDKMVKRFNNLWGELLPLEFALEIKNGRGFLNLTGKKILDTRDLPELDSFQVGRYVQVKSNVVPDADSAKSNVKTGCSRPSICGLFALGAVAAATVALAGMQAEISSNLAKF